MGALTDTEARKSWEYGLVKAALNNDKLELKYSNSKSMIKSYEFHMNPSGKFFIIEN
jgi:hypothetical protein